MSGGWIDWQGGSRPVGEDVKVAYKMRSEPCEWCGPDRAGNLRWDDQGRTSDIVAYRVVDEVVEPVREKAHDHYYKDVSHLNTIDVYRVLDLFDVTDQTIGHAAKKLLVAGGRGHKDIERDIQDVIDSLERWKEMRGEDKRVSNKA